MTKKVILYILAVVGFSSLAIIALVVLFFALAWHRMPRGDKVAVVEIEGVINNSFDINKQLQEFAEREDVKAIVIRIDSPGGGVGSSQEIYREVMKTKAKKLVVVSMGSVAASGGYYIAAASNRIVANPGTITGSIGVIMEFANVEALLNKIGLKGNVIKSGQFKDIGSPIREITAKEKKILQNVIDNLHGQFVDAIATGRGIERSKIVKVADGRFFTGTQALELQLIDELGNLGDAIDRAAALSGIKGRPVVIYPRKPFRWKEMVLGKSLGALLNELTTQFKIMYLWKPYTI